MKTRLLKFGLLTLLLTVFIGCKDCSECENQVTELTKKLDEANSVIKESSEILTEYKETEYLNSITNPILENGIIKQTDMSKDDIDASFLEIGRYDVFGDFSIKDDRITVFIPVTDNNLHINDYQNISTSNINVLLIRISNNSDNDTKVKPITKVIKKDFSIKDLGFTETKLRNDKKIKVIVLNENNSNISTQIAFYLKCLKKQTSYIKDSCLMPKNDFIRPNEDGGDILTGG